MHRSIGKQSWESVESVLKKKRKAAAGRICRKGRFKPVSVRVSEAKNNMKRSVAVYALAVAMATFLSASCRAASILLVPMNCHSHLIFFSRLGIDLAELGHVTTLLAPSSARVPDFVDDRVAGNFSYVQYAVDRATPLLNSPAISARLVAMAMARSPLHYMRLIRQYNEDVMRDSEQARPPPTPWGGGDACNGPHVDATPLFSPPHAYSRAYIRTHRRTD